MTSPETTRSPGLRIARVSGIPIYVGWGSLLFMLLLAYLLLSNWSVIIPGYSRWEYVGAVSLVTVLFMFSLLFHELAHSLLAQYFDVEVESVTLWLLGGVSVFRSAPQTPGADFWISVVGPLSSLFLSVMFGASWIALAFAGIGDLWFLSFLYLAAVNFVLAIFNLLPASPLDGGHVLRAIVWKITNNKRRATIVSTTSGQIFGVLFFVFALVNVLLWDNFNGIWYALIGWFIWTAATSEKQAAKRGLLDEF